VCFKDLDLQQGANIFESLMTAFKANSLFEALWGRCENWFEPKIKPP
jgi:hypothetical protein